MEKAAVFHAGNAAKLRSGVAKCHIQDTEMTLHLSVLCLKLKPPLSKGNG